MPGTPVGDPSAWLAGEAIGMASRCPVSSATRCTGLDSSLKRIEHARSSAFRQVTRSRPGLPLDRAPKGYQHFDARSNGWTKVVLAPAA
jgi:hypothetical protein